MLIDCGSLSLNNLSSAYFFVGLIGAVPMSSGEKLV